MADEDKKDDAPAFNLVEQPDGTALIEVVKDKPADGSAAADAAAIAAATGATIDAPAADEEEEDAGKPSPEQIAAEDAADPERAAIRARRRAEKQARKNFLRHRDQQQQNEIVTLRRQVDELNERLGGVQTAQQRSMLTELDNAVNNLSAREEELTGIIGSSEATPDQRAEATRQLTRVAQRLGQLTDTRDRAKRAAAAQPSATSAAERPRPAAAPDPRLQALAGQWMGKHSWYSPNKPDADTRVAMAIDSQLTAERWDPTTPEYWQELDQRLQVYLPHRFEGSDTIPGQGAPRRGNGAFSGGGPRGPAGGGDRPPGGGGGSTITLSAERVQAIKDAGAWDDPKQRARMISRYVDYDKNAAASGR